MSFGCTSFVQSTTNLDQLTPNEMQTVVQSLPYGTIKQLLLTSMYLGVISGKTSKYPPIAITISTLIDKKVKEKNELKEKSAEEIMDSTDDEMEGNMLELDEPTTTAPKLDELATDLVGEVLSFLGGSDYHSLCIINRRLYLQSTAKPYLSTMAISRHDFNTICLYHHRFNQLNNYKISTNKLNKHYFKENMYKTITVLSITSNIWTKTCSEIFSKEKKFENIKILKLSGVENHRFVSCINAKSVECIDFEDCSLSNLFPFLADARSLKQCKLQIKSFGDNKKEIDEYLNIFPPNINEVTIGLLSKYDKWLKIKNDLNKMVKKYNPLHLRLDGDDTMVLKMINAHKNIDRHIVLLSMPFNRTVLNKCIAFNANKVKKTRLNIIEFVISRLNIKHILYSLNEEDEDDDISLCVEALSDDDLLKTLMETNQFKSLLDKLQSNGFWDGIRVKLWPRKSAHIYYNKADSNKNVLSCENMERFSYNSCSYKKADKKNSCKNVYYFENDLFAHSGVHRQNLSKTESVCLCGKFSDNKRDGKKHNDLCKYIKNK